MAARRIDRGRAAIHGVIVADLGPLEVETRVIEHVYVGYEPYLQGAAGTHAEDGREGPNP